MQKGDEMKSFDYGVLDRLEVPIDIYRLIAKIYEYKGKQFFYTNKESTSLEKFILHTKLNSTISSNMIEGIYTTPRKSKEIILKNRAPKNLVEQEIMGYSKVYDLITENYDDMDISSNLILQLHRDLYKYTSLSFGGKYKNVDNFIVSIDQFGNKKTIFTPTKAIFTKDALESLCKIFNKELDNNQIEPLILIPIFIMDFLSIHPFTDGNGRVSRLLTNLLLNKFEFDVCKYISYEKNIYDNLERYYKVLNESSKGWHENQNSYFGFIRYTLILLIESYREFDEEFIQHANTKLSKREKVIGYIDDYIGAFSKSELTGHLRDISETTIERVLKELVDKKYIIKIGDKKATKYRKKR